MTFVVSVMLVIVVAIHLLPVPGVLSEARLKTFYGVGPQDASVVILLRHRAVLFGLLAAFFILSAVWSALQPAALIAGFVSVLSFLWLARSSNSGSPAIDRVVQADLLTLTCLVIGAVAWLLGWAIA